MITLRLPFGRGAFPLLAAGLLSMVVVALGMGTAWAGERGYGGGHRVKRGGGDIGKGIAIGVGIGIIGTIVNEAAKNKRSRSRSEGRPPRRSRGCPRGTRWSGRSCIPVKTAGPQRSGCPANAVPSRKRRGKCSCRAGYRWSKRGGRNVCVASKKPPKPPVVAVKPRCNRAHEYLSKKSGKCRCRRGYTRGRGSACVRPTPTKPVETVERAPRTPVAPMPDVDISQVQTCLQRAGFDPGSVDGRPGGKTQKAFRAFQRKHGLSKRPNRITDHVTLSRLLDLCDGPATPTVVATPAPAAPAPAAPPVATRAPVTPRAVAPALATAVSVATAGAATAMRAFDGPCLPGDLYDLISATYGEPKGLRRCDAACLPKPAGYGEAELEALRVKHGLTWCTSCIRLASHVSLADILEIEKRAGVTLCASPPAQMCHLPTREVIRTYGKVRTIFRRLPVSVGNEGDIAVIVGNEAYGDTMPDNVNGQRDAGAVRTLLTEQLGFQDKNIIDLRNASRAELERVFGTGERPEGELAARFAKSGRGDVFVYVSSHGMTSEEAGRSYLLPVDARVEALDETAYPLQLLYENLGKVGARTIMLVLEANFGRSLAELAQPPNLPQMDVDVMPESPIAGLAVFKASDRDQQTLEDPEYGIGLFTRYLIEGLAGKADAAPLGNGDSRVDTVELFVYTSNLVRMAARKSFGLEQKPLLSRIDNLVVGRLAQR